MAMGSTEATQYVESLDFDRAIPLEEWRLYRQVLDALDQRAVPYALGGGLAFSAYARRWRDTKDLDLFVRPADRERAIEGVQSAGFSDYFDQLPYDRHWIFRGFRDGLIADVIWQMVNNRAEVDPTWLSCGPQITIWETPIRLLPVEELIWSKLYVLQRDRCDWPDLLNILCWEGATLNWQHLLHRVGTDAPILGGLLNIFRWLCPDTAQRLPGWIWPSLGLAPMNGRRAQSGDASATALDSREWFGPQWPGRNEG